MSIPLEHDYIGLSGPLPLGGTSENSLSSSSSSTLSCENEKKTAWKLKETELRLGLPGSESPEGKYVSGISLFGKELKEDTNSRCSDGPLKNLMLGAKRGFYDATNGCGQWALPINGGSEADLGNSVLFSPKGMKNGAVKSSNTWQSCLPAVSAEEVAINSPIKPLEEEKNEQGGSAPPSKAQVVGWPPIRSFRKNALVTNLFKNGGFNNKSGSVCLYVKVSMEGAPYLRKIDLKTYCSYAELSSALENMFSCFTIGQCGHRLAGQERLGESCLVDLLHGSEYVLTYEDKDGDWMLVGDVPWEMFMNSCMKLRIMKSSDAIGLAPRTAQKCKGKN